MTGPPCTSATPSASTETSAFDVPDLIENNLRIDQLDLVVVTAFLLTGGHPDGFIADIRDLLPRLHECFQDQATLGEHLSEPIAGRAVTVSKLALRAGFGCSTAPSLTRPGLRAVPEIQSNAHCAAVHAGHQRRNGEASRRSRRALPPVEQASPGPPQSAASPPESRTTAVSSARAQPRHHRPTTGRAGRRLRSDRLPHPSPAAHGRDAALHGAPTPTLFPLRLGRRKTAIVAAAAVPIAARTMIENQVAVARLASGQREHAPRCHQHETHRRAIAVGGRR